MAPNIERYVGRDNIPDPLDIWGDDLEVWLEADGGVILQSDVFNTVQTWGDRSGKRRNFDQFVPSEQPTLFLGGGGNGLAAIRFDQAAGEALARAGFVFSDSMYTVLVANYTGAAGARSLFDAAGANPSSIGVDGVGAWEYRSDVAPIGGPAATAAPTIVSLVQTLAVPTGARFRVDQADVGSNAATPTAPTNLTLSNTAPVTSWGGEVSMLVIAHAETPNDSRLLRTEEYAARKYQ